MTRSGKLASSRRGKISTENKILKYMKSHSGWIDCSVISKDLNLLSMEVEGILRSWTTVERRVVGGEKKSQYRWIGNDNTE